MTLFVFTTERREHTKCSLCESDILYCLMTNISSFLIWWQQHVSKKLGQVHVSHCVASHLLLTIVCKHLGTEETSCRTFGREFFVVFQMFSVGESSGLLAGHSTTRLFYYEAMLYRCSMWFNIVLLKMCKVSPEKRRCLDGSICCSKTCIYLSALMELFQMCRFPGPYTLMPPIPSEMQALN